MWNSRYAFWVPLFYFTWWFSFSVIYVCNSLLMLAHCPQSCIPWANGMCPSAGLCWWKPAARTLDFAPALLECRKAAWYCHACHQPPLPQFLPCRLLIPTHLLKTFPGKEIYLPFLSLLYYLVFRREEMGQYTSILLKDGNSVHNVIVGTDLPSQLWRIPTYMLKSATRNLIS